MIVSFAYRNLSADVLKVFDIFNTRNMMKTITVRVLLGLYKNVPLPPLLLFSGSSASCNLLQISGFIHLNMHFRQLVHFSVTPCIPIQQRLVITIATTACGAYALSLKQSICLEKITHTHINFQHEILFHGIYEGKSCHQVSRLTFLPGLGTHTALLLFLPPPLLSSCPH